MRKKKLDLNDWFCVLFAFVCFIFVVGICYCMDSVLTKAVTSNSSITFIDSVEHTNIGDEVGVTEFTGAELQALADGGIKVNCITSDGSIVTDSKYEYIGKQGNKYYFMLK